MTKMLDRLRGDAPWGVWKFDRLRRSVQPRVDLLGDLPQARHPMQPRDHT
ncbi:hypothetical protein LPH50_04785 [Xylella taiwanensis]|uniref:Uncharacterized protein n=1 Tax=Xylella taiwanensis TaxID=1444770 RepID=A0ABS8TRP8_9GAMM|nr:hypothetical protein [Xylella taiwanensis]MCD8455297.1 hypothetical protein [Xylella taiwanensis]MCD8457702.1 hypothetical protein [Xylella taiwanensis]MCD8459840.1 hypothetical protein [Xylella taiwanensis]MCD8464100.1 hypothetical protein [Xylella taiwanensis]MCD8464344.1 hypothetical protein [Xylella taiwanensis]